MMDHCISASKTLLKQLSIKYTDQYLEDNVLSHPHHPSLLSITDTLDKYNIENLAVRINAEKLSQLPLPCIVQVSDDGGIFYVLKQYSEDKIEYLSDNGKSIFVPRDNFLERWTGICLLAETSKDSREPGIEKKLADKMVMSIFKGSLLVLFIGWIVISMMKSPLSMSIFPVIFVSLYTILKLIGLATGTMLLWYEVDKYNPTLQSICSGGSKINCESVLGSRYAKLFNGFLSLSVLGFSYFFGTLCYMLVYGFSGPSLSLSALLSFATLPVIAMSIYYQAVAIKQWCKLCIIVKVVLVLEMLAVILGNLYSYPISMASLPLLLALLLLPVIAWKSIKPLLDAKKETHLYKRGLKKIKNNPEVLEGLLAKTRKITTSIEGLGISLSSKNAKYNIVKVCNPYCGPCSKAHSILEELVDSGKINLRILFTTRPDEDGAKPVRHFLALDTEGDKVLTKKALRDWYNSEKKEYEVFSKKYALNGELEQQNDKVSDMRQWCDEENIIYTPTIFINGRELPKEYKVEDLIEVLS